MIIFRTGGALLIGGVCFVLLCSFAQNKQDSLLKELPRSEFKSAIHNQLAETTLEDSPDLSMNYAEQALQQALIERNIREQGLAYFHIAEVYSVRFQPDSAISNYQKALGLLKQTNDNYSTSYILNNLGWIHNAYGRYRKALGHYLESIHYLDAGKHADDLAHLYINIGNTYHQLASYYTAIKYFRKAQSILITTEDRSSLPIVYNGLGLAYKYLSHFDSAIYYYNAMLEIDRSVGTPYDLAIDYGNIGSLYFEWKQYDQAFRFHQLAMQIYQEEGNKNDLSVAYNNIGEIYKARGQYDSSLHFLFRALEIDMETGIVQNIASRNNNIGDVYADLKDYQKALDHYNEALRINRKNGSLYNVALNLSNIANVIQIKGDDVKAEKVFLESLEIATSIQAKTLIKSILERMVFFYSGIGQYEAALTYHLKIDMLNDSIFRNQTRQMLADLQTRHELDQKQKEINFLNRENEIHLKEAEQYRSSAFLLAGSLFVISGLLVVLLIQYNLRRRAYRKLVQKNAELVETEKLTPDNEFPTKDNPPSNGDLKPGIGNHKELYQKIKRSIITEKPYLKQDLTVKEWAEQLQTNTHYLSEVINQKFGNNFTGLINEFRVREACRLLADENNDHLTIESIAIEAGFNSKSAFNNAFKSITGLTPSFYKKSVRSNL